MILVLLGSSACLLYLPGGVIDAGEVADRVRPAMCSIVSRSEGYTCQEHSTCYDWDVLYEPQGWAVNVSATLNGVTNCIDWGSTGLAPECEMLAEQPPGFRFACEYDPEARAAAAAGKRPDGSGAPAQHVFLPGGARRAADSIATTAKVMIPIMVFILPFLAYVRVLMANMSTASAGTGCSMFWPPAVVTDDVVAQSVWPSIGEDGPVLWGTAIRFKAAPASRRLPDITWLQRLPHKFQCRMLHEVLIAGSRTHERSKWSPSEASIQRRHTQLSRPHGMPVVLPTHEPMGDCNDEQLLWWGQPRGKTWILLLLRALDGILFLGFLFAAVAFGFIAKDKAQAGGSQTATMAFLAVTFLEFAAMFSEFMYPVIAGSSFDLAGGNAVFVLTNRRMLKIAAHTTPLFYRLLSCGCPRRRPCSNGPPAPTSVSVESWDYRDICVNEQALGVGQVVQASAGGEGLASVHCLGDKAQWTAAVRRGTLPAVPGAGGRTAAPKRNRALGRVRMDRLTQAAADEALRVLQGELQRTAAEMAAALPAAPAGLASSGGASTSSQADPPSASAAATAASAPVATAGSVVSSATPAAVAVTIPYASVAGAGAADGPPASSESSASGPAVEMQHLL